MRLVLLLRQRAPRGGDQNRRQPGIVHARFDLVVVRVANRVAQVLANRQRPAQHGKPRVFGAGEQFFLHDSRTIRAVAKRAAELALREDRRLGVQQQQVQAGQAIAADANFGPLGQVAQPPRRNRGGQVDLAA